MSDKFLEVSERFYSIQGESTRAGLPCLFIRMAGCNLRCSYCDSSYTWEEQGQKTPLDEILQWVDGYPGVMVELTGGEPLLQEESYILTDALLSKGRTVLIETNGSLPIDRVSNGASVILDIKCPDSGMDSTNNWDNIELLADRAQKGCRDEVKFVLSSENDFLWARDIAEKYRLIDMIPVLFSANETKFRAKVLAGLILHHKLTVRLQIQLHRILWPELDRGA